MPYQTTIPDGFKPPQFRDDKFYEALALYSAKHKPGAQWVVSIPRPDLDPSSRIRFDFGAHVTYALDAKVDQVSVQHVIGVGRGRVRLGYREIMPVNVGDLVLVNLREAGHWQYIEGMLTYWWTGDVAMARMYRTTKTITPPATDLMEECDARRVRAEWEDELFWNIAEPLNDYVLLGRDPEAERYMFRGPETMIVAPGSTMTDGHRSDSARDNRFPIVYRRVLGAGPGRAFRRESDLGLVEREETIPEVRPGDMLTYSKTLKAATFTFQGMPLEIIHCASTMNIELCEASRRAINAECCGVHDSVPQPIPWDVPQEADPDEDAQLRGETG